ncbi:MAG: PepSY-like domain-containing protein [Bacteroidales bacterium]|nr:PepSY-like domain-containing protein [Bacteroidales bacterium]
MKNLIFLMLVSTLFMVSCSKEESTSSTASEEISVSAAPTAIVTYINENYPDAAITSILKSTSGSTGYTVTLDTYEQISFDSYGNAELKGESALYCDSVSGSHHGGHHGNGHHGGHGGGHHGGNSISLDSIPSAISEYVTANFPGYSIHNAQYDTLCQFGVVLNVMIDSSRADHHKLIFDASGLYLALAHRVDSLEVPTAVFTAVATSYPTYEIRKKVEMLTLESGVIEYRVFLHQETGRLSVIFLADGTVVCEQ